MPVLALGYCGLRGGYKESLCPPLPEALNVFLRAHISSLRGKERMQSNIEEK